MLRIWEYQRVKKSLPVIIWRKIQNIFLFSILQRQTCVIIVSYCPLWCSTKDACRKRLTIIFELRFGVTGFHSNESSNLYISYKLSKWTLSKKCYAYHLQHNDLLHLEVSTRDRRISVSQVYLSQCLRFEDVVSGVPESVAYYRVQFPRLSPSLLRAWSRILMLVSIYVVFHPFRCKE